MTTRRTRAKTILRALVHEIRIERVTFIASSIAYHAFVSMLPLLLLVLAAISFLGATSLEDGLVRLAEAVLTPGASEALLSEVDSANAATGVSVLGAGLLIWGTLRIFRGLDTAFSDIYESGTANSFADQLLDGIMVLVAVVFAVVVGAIVETRLGGLSAIPGGWLLERLVLVAGLVVVLFPMYYVFPDEDDMLLREAIPGTVFAAVGLTAFQTLFRIYVQVSSRSPEESLVAAILVFLTWLYFSGLVILLGVVINAVLTNRSADVSIEPVIGHRRPSMDEADTIAAEEIAPRVRTIERTLQDGTEVSVSVDGETVLLPAPTSVEVETDGYRLGLLGRTTELRLAWTTGSNEEE